MKKVNDAPKNAFIIMPFQQDFFGYYDRIYKPALESAGYKVNHAAEINEIKPITDQILNCIKNADMILCDLTNKNPNVMYELGIAHAIGKPVLLLAQNTKDISFDIAHIRIVFYNTNDKNWEIETFKKIVTTANATANSEEPWPKPLVDPVVKISDSWSVIFSTFIKVIGKKLAFPIKAGFVIRFLAALAAGVLGGAIWTMIFRRGLGGSSAEPHLMDALMWGLVTNIPVVLALIILNIFYRFSEFRKIWFTTICYLLVMALSGFIFYDIRLSDHIGFRQYLEFKLTSFMVREILLVIIWSALCSLLPLFAISHFVLKRVNIAKVYLKVFQMSFLTILITTMCVSFYLFFLPHDPMFDAGRGVVAGVALRVMLFMSLYNILVYGNNSKAKVIA
ncbi:MAG: hypothetical protein JW857_11075 [Bacteroidales bacterium]|nr:hypothetical protein [Bacteroidales bacterium]